MSESKENLTAPDNSIREQQVDFSCGDTILQYKDGKYYYCLVIVVDLARKKCLIKFPDNSFSWLLFRELKILDELRNEQSLHIVSEKSQPKVDNDATTSLGDHQICHQPRTLASQLKSLNLSHNLLTYVPANFEVFENLEYLNCAANQIIFLPSSLSNLSRLKQVNLSNNQIMDFPLMFCGLKHLNVLDLSGNRLTIVPNAAVGLYVIELNLNQNKIATISENLAVCPRLKTLRLKNNCLQLSSVPLRLLKNSKISMLELEGNFFEMKQFTNLDGYNTYMKRHTSHTKQTGSVKKKCYSKKKFVTILFIIILISIIMLLRIFFFELKLLP